MDKFKKKIQEQAKEKMSEGGGDKKSNNYKNRVSPNGEKRSDTKIHTDKELAKMAGVGTGTVARYNRVMKELIMQGGCFVRYTFIYLFSTGYYDCPSLLALFYEVNI